MSRCLKRTKFTAEQVRWLRNFWPDDRYIFCEQHNAWHRVKASR